MPSASTSRRRRRPIAASTPTGTAWSIEDARLFRDLQPDLVFSDVAYLPLAGAARAGIPSVSMCSLNWADEALLKSGKRSA
jgi:hypothetical protein